MARRWENFSDWEGGGFFGVGSYDGQQRYNALNMQRYANGSLGPRPQWRKLTQTADSGSTIPTPGAASLNSYAAGTGWSSWAPSGWTYGAIIYPVAVALFSRRVRIVGDGSCVFFGSANLGTTLGTDVLHPSEAAGINAAQVIVDGSNPVYVGGAQYYDPSADTVANVTARTVNSANFYPNKLAIYRNRMYGWQSLTSSANDEYMVYSRTTDFTNFSGTDGGDFRVSAAVSGFDTALPRGLWPLKSGLLIFTSEGPVRSTSGYPGVTTQWADFGRWYLLTGTDPSVGSLTPIDYNVGPMFHSLGVIHDGNLLFPVHKQGWAIHDGDSLDQNIMGSVQPGRGQSTEHLWLAPVKTHNEKALILPYKIEDTDPTADAAGIGEFYNHGYGAFEWVNGAWTEALYNHGSGVRFAVNNLEHDKLYGLSFDTPDDGVSVRPQFYTRDVTLNRPSTSTDAFSDNEETTTLLSDSTGSLVASGSVTTGHMVAFVETAESRAPSGNQIRVDAISIEFDYWNSDLFDSDCGFDVELVYRSSRNGDKQVRRINPGRVSPPADSVGLVPKRGHYVTNITPVTCGTFQIRVLNVVGVAIHSIDARVDDAKDPYFGD